MRIIGLAALVAACAGGGGALADPEAHAPPTPQEVVQAKFEAVNRHAVEDIVAFYAPDALLTASDFCAPRQGRAEVERTYRRIFELIPDATVSVQEYVVQGEKVAVRFVLQSRAPGRTFDFPIMNFFTVRDGLIIRDDGMFDNGGRACTP